MTINVLNAENAISKQWNNMWHLKGAHKIVVVEVQQEPYEIATMRDIVKLIVVDNKIKFIRNGEFKFPEFSTSVSVEFSKKVEIELIETDDHELMMLIRNGGNIRNDLDLDK